MKKSLILFLAALLFVIMAFSANAKDVYVNDGGVGDGLSAAAPLGSMEDAINAISEEGGVVHIVEIYTNDGAFHEPEHSAPITVTGGEFVYTGEQNRWYLNGETTFENIKLTAADEKKGMVIAAQLNPIVMGENVVTPAKTYLLGAHQLDGMKTDTEAAMAEKGWAIDKDSYITIKSGTYHVVCGFSRGASDAKYTGTSHISIEGGTVNLVLGGTCEGSSAQNSAIDVSGGEITTVYTANNKTHPVHGDSVVNISGGTVSKLEVSNVMGEAVVNISGGAVSAATKRIDDVNAELVTNGKATLNIGEGATVISAVSDAFDEVIGTSSKPAPIVELPTEITAAAATTAAVVDGGAESGSSPIIIAVIAAVVVVLAVVVLFVVKKKRQ